MHSAWRWEQDRKPASTRCSATSVTTGKCSSSTLEYARNHNHPPSAGRVGAYKVKKNRKTVVSQDRKAKPHKIVLNNLRDVTEITNNSLPEEPSMKKTVQRKRDHEQGAYNAVFDVFPGIGEEGSFFHLCKRLDFQVKRLGLMPKYQTDDDFKLRVKMLAALRVLHAFWLKAVCDRKGNSGRTGML